MMESFPHQEQVVLTEETVIEQLNNFEYRSPEAKELLKDYIFDLQSRAESGDNFAVATQWADYMLCRIYIAYPKYHQSAKENLETLSACIEFDPNAEFLREPIQDLLQRIS